MTDAGDKAAFLAKLKRFEGVVMGESTARDPVNAPMIRHWCDAVEDENPVYTDPEYAAATSHGGIVAPPTMLQAWTMPGLVAHRRPAVRASAHRELFALLDDAGFTSVVATNCRQEYARYLRPGDLLTVTSEIESVSDEKETALGTGHFVGQRMIYRDQHGGVVATMQFRMLKFRPKARGDRDEAPESAPRRSRPRPGITHDNRFFWEGVEREELRIQRCADCGRLRHPPGPMCPHCRSLASDSVEACGRGHVYSFVVAHHPKVPPFEYPNPIALVELEEGTRIVANLCGVDPDEIRIGMPVEVEFRELDDGAKLFFFRPAGDAP